MEFNRKLIGDCNIVLKEEFKRIKKILEKIEESRKKHEQLYDFVSCRN